MSSSRCCLVSFRCCCVRSASQAVRSASSWRCISLMASIVSVSPGASRAESSSRPSGRISSAIRDDPDAEDDACESAICAAFCAGGCRSNMLRRTASRSLSSCACGSPDVSTHFSLIVRAKPRRTSPSLIVRPCRSRSASQRLPRFSVPLLLNRSTNQSLPSCQYNTQCVDEMNSLRNRRLLGLSRPTTVRLRKTRYVARRCSLTST